MNSVGEENYAQLRNTEE